MTILLAPLPVQSFKDANGNPLSGGQLYTYVAGTSTLLTTYTDATGTTLNTNPVILNSRGECGLWLTSGLAYKLVLQDSYSVLIWSVDQILNGASSGANSDITSLSGLTTPLSLAQGGTGATAFDAARYALSASSSGFRNAIINGDQAIDPNAGVSVLITAGAALAPATEMFYMACTGGNAFFQQVSGANSRKRMLFTAGSSGTSSIIFGTRIEARNSQDLAGMVSTLSSKLSSNIAQNLSWAIYYANTADTFGTLASPTRTAIANGSFSVTTAETVYSVFSNMPTGATTGLEVVFTTGALVAGQTLTVGDIQLEPGGIAPSAITFEKVEINAQKYRTLPYFETGRFRILATSTAAGQIFHTDVVYKAVKRTTPVFTLAVNTNTNTASNVQFQGIPESTGYYVTSGAAGAVEYTINYSANARLF